jgi:hypothetical protein
VGLVGGDEGGPAPHTHGAHGERRRDAASVADAAGCDYGHRTNRVHDLGDESHRADVPSVASGFMALGHDQVGTTRSDPTRRLHVANEANNLGAGGVHLLHVWRRITEPNS